MNILKNGKSSKFFVEGDWNSKNSQNVHHLIFWKKLNGVLDEKLDFFKTSKCSY